MKVKTIENLEFKKFLKFTVIARIYRKNPKDIIELTRSVKGQEARSFK